MLLVCSCAEAKYFYSTAEGGENEGGALLLFGEGANCEEIFITHYRSVK